MSRDFTTMKLLFSNRGYGAMLVQVFFVMFITTSVLANGDEHDHRAKLQEPNQRAIGTNTYTPQPKRKRIPIIVDTDMDIDDMMALIVLLNNPDIEIKGITVLSDGWSSQYAGVVQAMKLTQKYGQPDIPVAYMSGPLTGATQLNTVAPPQDLPPSAFKKGIDTYLTESVFTAANLRPPAWQSADQLLDEVLHHAADMDEPIHILALGPWTNLARMLHRASNTKQRPVLKGLGKLFVSGMSYAGATIHEVNTTAYVPFLNYSGIASVPTGSCWNIFSDPISTSQVLMAIQVYNQQQQQQQNSSNTVEDDQTNTSITTTEDDHDHDPTVIIMSDIAEKMMFVDPDDDRYIPSSCPKEEANYLTAFYQKFASSGGQTDAKVRYWDPSSAVLLLDYFDLLPAVLDAYEEEDPDPAGSGRDPDPSEDEEDEEKNSSLTASLFCSEYQDIAVQVNVIAGPNYATTVRSDDYGTKSKICLSAKEDIFKKVFFSSGCQNWGTER